MKRRLLVAAAFVLPAMGILAASDPAGNGLVVHEWGTFLAMHGSDGITLDGMYHEEHALPPFVHARSKDQLRLRTSNMKGETPVIYFYTPRPTRVRVEVGFPAGLWTQWYPQAEMVGPGLAQVGSPPQLRNGRISWAVDVVPPSAAHGQPPQASRDALWNHAREVDAAYVSAPARVQPGAPREWERFIFYRGLGHGPLPIDVRASSGRVTARTTEAQGLQHLFVLRVEQGRGAFEYVPSLRPGEVLSRAVPAMDTALPLDQFADDVSDAVAARLVDAGLFDKEARAMVNTWRSSYFRSDGVRVLFVLPQSWTDRYIPMRIEPRPSALVRVMVGRVELLTPERERLTESAIRDLASPDAAVRERAFSVLRDQGRYVEPIVRRTLETSTDERVRMLCRRLLLTDFVTEMRTALTDAATGERTLSDPVYVRAQLASLLREVGLVDEAAQEGRAALAELERMAPPRMSDHASRNTFRALARASEGSGNDKAALKWYGEFVRFGSQMCDGCHTTEGPRDTSFFRDWYAGRKFGEYAVRTGEAPRLIAAHEATLASSPANLGAQLGLAYLYEARGDAARARALWERISPR